MIKLVQITDLHLGPEADYILNGVNVQQRLEAVLAELSDWQPQLVIATGDLADRGHPAAYQRLHGLLRQMPCDVAVIPGNHDDTAGLTEHLCGGNVQWSDRWEQDGWRFWMLDSSVAGHPHGHLSSAVLDDLKRDTGALHGMVFVHHHPVPVASSWIDAMMLDNGQELLDGLPPVTKAVFFGHVHQNFHAMHKDVAVLGTASTCYQIKPRVDQFALDEQSDPVYRSIELDADGQWRTAVHAVTLP